MCQSRKASFVILESRRRKDDESLELEFRRLIDRKKINIMTETFVLLEAAKRTNSFGLQVADTVARRLGLHTLRPNQTKTAVEFIFNILRVADWRNAWLWSENSALEGETPE